MEAKKNMVDWVSQSEAGSLMATTPTIWSPVTPSPKMDCNSC